MPSPNDVLQIFRDNDGLAEYPDGSNRNFVTTWYGLHDAWCAMMVSYACVKAGFANNDETIKMPGIKFDTRHGWQYVPSMVRKFIDAGWFSTEPRVGAAAFIVYPSSGSWRDTTYNAPGDHVAVVESWNEHTVTTWDGNISNRVKRVTRPRSYFYGFGLIPYDGEDKKKDEEIMKPETEVAIQRLADPVNHISDIMNRFFAGVSVGAGSEDDAYSGAKILGAFVGKVIKEEEESGG